MQSSAERSKSGEDNAVRVGPCGRRHPGGQGRGGQLVIGQQHERRIKRGNLRRARPLAVTAKCRPQTRRRAAVGGRGVSRQDLERSGQHPTAGAPDRVRTPIAAPSAGDPERRDDHRDQVDRARRVADSRADTRDERELARIQLPGACESPSHSSPAISSKLRKRASSTASRPRKNSRPSRSIAVRWVSTTTSSAPDRSLRRARPARRSTASVSNSEGRWALELWRSSRPRLTYAYTVSRLTPRR